MKWSKLKKVIEELLADPLKGRVAYHLTRYGPGVSHLMNRGWVTFDQQEILTASSIKWYRESFRFTGEWYLKDPEISKKLREQGIFGRHEYVKALEEYVDMKIDDALGSLNPLILAFAMFDRRLGKRRLRELNWGEETNRYVKDFYRIRCQVEGINIPSIGGKIG